MCTEKLNLFSLGGEFYLHLCAFLCFTNLQYFEHQDKSYQKF